MRRTIALVTAVLVCWVPAVAAARATRQARVLGTSCPTTAQCYAVGDQVVLASTDGGADWQHVSSPPHVATLEAIVCRTARRCLAVGSDEHDQGAVWLSIDAGTTWYRRSAQLPGGVFAAISCPSGTFCVATGNNGVAAVTSDGGRTWAEQTVAGVSMINSVDCLTPTVCEAVGYDGADGIAGVSVRTTDGGQSWTTSPLPSTIPSPSGLSCTTTTDCVAVGQDTVRAGSVQKGRIVVTRDGGQSWHLREVPSGTSEVFAVDCPTARHCVAGSYGPHGMLVTDDGGTTWTPHGPAVAVIRAVSCVSDSACVAAGDLDTGAGGAAYRSTNGGRSWTRSPIG